MRDVLFGLFFPLLYLLTGNLELLEGLEMDLFFLQLLLDQSENRGVVLVGKLMEVEEGMDRVREVGVLLDQKDELVGTDVYGNLELYLFGRL